MWSGAVALLLAVAKFPVPAFPQDPFIFRTVYPEWEPRPVQTKDLGQRLILTPYIRNSSYEEGRKLAKVELNEPEPPLLSYSGFLTVDEKYNSNLFFWYFPAQNTFPLHKLKVKLTGCFGWMLGTRKKEAPLILWLQGGPGATSLFGLFTEIGPYRVVNDSLERMPNSWNEKYSLLFIDNPVGTGFSFTDSPLGYTRSQELIAKHLYDALTQFFLLFPDEQGSPFFLMGESYAGKHIPSVGYEIYKKNQDSDLWINLKGMAIGNGFTDPDNCLDYSEYTFQLGLTDPETKKEMKAVEAVARAHIKEGLYLPAYYAWMTDIWLFLKASNYTNLYNVLVERGTSLNAEFSDFVQRPDVRNALHVGDAEFSNIEPVYRHLLADFMRTTKHLVEEMLSEYRIMFYSGQLDIIVPYPLSVEMFRSLNFPGRECYLRANRKPWYVGDRLAGYFRKGGNLVEAMVRNAGHMAPADQPEWTFDLIDKFVNDKL